MIYGGSRYIRLIKRSIQTTIERQETTVSEEIFAHINTTEGNFTISLHAQKAPKTVGNFVELAEGTKAWTDPRTGQQSNDPYYNGVLFHRVISGFMIQTGDPLGNGTGGPGYEFNDEFHQELRHNKAGILSMANSGPNTNGGQIFITLAPTPHLNDRHSVFGEVTDGMDIVKAIGQVQTGMHDRPVSEVKIKTVTIERRS